MKDSPCPQGSRDKWGEQNHNQCNDYCDEGVWGWVAWTHRVGVPDPALGVREGSVKGRGWSIFQGWGMSLGKAPEINMPYICTSKSFWAKCFILPLTSQCCFELPEKLKKKWYIVILFHNTLRKSDWTGSFIDTFSSQWFWFHILEYACLTKKRKITIPTQSKMSQNGTVLLGSPNKFNQINNQKNQINKHLLNPGSMPSTMHDVVGMG